MWFMKADIYLRPGWFVATFGLPRTPGQVGGLSVISSVFLRRKTKTYPGPIKTRWLIFDTNRRLMIGLGFLGLFW